MNISKEEGQYTRQELAPEDFERNREFIERIREFIGSKETVIPASGMIELERSQFELAKDAIGLSAFASIMAAKENQAPLFADDLGLRELARGNEHLGGVEGFSTLSVLAELKEQGVLSQEEYFAATRKLILGNYRFVSINADFLMWVFKESDFKAVPEVIKIFSTLQGPDCNEDTAVIVGADLTKMVWLEFDFVHQKMALLELLLAVLTSRRIESQVIEKFTRALNQRFFLVPFVVKPILEYVGNWRRQNVLKKGIALWSPEQKL